MCDAISCIFEISLILKTTSIAIWNKNRVWWPLYHCIHHDYYVTRAQLFCTYVSDLWSGGIVVRAMDLRLRRSRVRLLASRFQLTTLGKLFTLICLCHATPEVTGSTPGLTLSANNPRQVVRTHLPLSPSSIIWYRSRGGDALRLGR